MHKPLLALALIVPVHAAAQTMREGWQAPSLTNTRFDEDWSHLSDPALRAKHWTGAAKYIPLADNVWLSTGGELRLRSETLTNPQWGAEPNQTYLWTRLLPYADLHAGRLRAFVQPIAGFAQGMKPAAGGIDQTRFDLLQGFAEADLGSVTLRAGRQLAPQGSERLVGARYGPNTPLAFDGLRVMMRIAGTQVHLLALRPVQAGLGDWDDHTSHNKALWGAYLMRRGWDAYYLTYRNRKAIFSGTSGEELRHSLGLRSYGQNGRLHWNVEGVAQWGRWGSQRITAWTLGSEAGVSFPHLPLKPDATIRLNIVSGDSGAQDRHLGTFNALFPRGKYFGELSPIGPANIINLNPRLSAKLAHNVSASLSAMAYWRYSRADGVYDVPGNLVRAAGHAPSRFIGGGGEAQLAWQATPELELSSSLSVFNAGAFLRETGPARDTTMLGLQANFRF